MEPLHIAGSGGFNSQFVHHRIRGRGVRRVRRLAEAENYAHRPQQQIPARRGYSMTVIHAKCIHAVFSSVSVRVSHIRMLRHSRMRGSRRMFRASRFRVEGSAAPQQSMAG